MTDGGSSLPGRAGSSAYSALILAALMIGHHRSISPFWNARNASGDCCTGGDLDAKLRKTLSPRDRRALAPSSHSAGDDILRRAPGYPKAVPERSKEAGQTRLVRGR